MFNKYLQVLGCGLLALSLSACTSSTDSSYEEGGYHQGATYQVNDYDRLISPYSLIPNGTDLQYLRLTHLMTGSERVCVLNSGDFTNGQYVVRNSGSYVQRSIADNISQHGNPIVLLNGSNPSLLQDTARDKDCNIIAVSKLLSWHHNSDGSPYISIRLDMYDTSSLSLLNSVRFMAGANSLIELYDDSKGVIKPLIATYIHKLYQN